MEECIQAVKFLIAMARIEEGAAYVIQENLIKIIATSSLIQRVNSEDLYLEAHSGHRNPTHLLWCFFLLLLRLLNAHFGANFDHKACLSQQLLILDLRAVGVLNFLADKTALKQANSLALLEELELLTGVIQ